MLLYRFLKPEAVLLSKIFFLLRVYNKKNIPLQGGVIIASNHLSFLDPLLLGVASPRPLYFMAKEELFKSGIFSYLIRNLGAFELKKGKPDKRAIEKAVTLLKKKQALVIFPEGTRSKNGDIHAGEAGCVWIAKISKSLIVPTRIYGSNVALPVNGKILRPYPVKVIFGRALNIRDYPDIGLENLTQILMQKIREL